MARPRTIELKDGKVSLSGFPPEVSGRLAEYIKDFESPSVVVQAVTDVALGSTMSLEQLEKYVSPENIIIHEKSILNSSLTDIALGVRLNPITGKYEVVEVKYDAESKQARVDEIQIEAFKKDATNVFKVKAAKLDFV